ncbi:hypothetical protein PAXRUDRAFT_821964 [Paxillus rubicundulus Ve08.2h10]|uniref:Extracellular membrane protein CFEM domain-containing protein n=1 Tax=Paxillus rubicundulus Ve08.2h10 TaxID=930991 RepID=A0A0D0EAA5_9AGAM|nr:hypothetical protein PAXRUDRAFT_821964 [Paxillus rubicundulus Ve08.2h10]
MVQILPLLQALSAAVQVTPSDQSHNDLVVRQISTSGLPAACQTPCNVINTITNCGDNISCICTSSVGSELQQCLNCLVAADPSVDGQAQAVINTWNEACGGSLTLSGGSSSSGTPSTSSPSSGGLTSGSGGSAPGTAPKLGSATGLKTADIFVGIVTAFVGGFVVLCP